MDKNNFKKFLIGVVLIGLSYWSGYLLGHDNLRFEKTLVPKLVNRELRKPREVDFSLFWDAYKQIQDNYAGKVENQKLLYGAIEGLVSGLGDQFSGFMNPQQSKLFLEDLSGRFSGVGIEVAKKDNAVVVIAPLDNSPAQKAGVRAGDIIQKIDGVDTHSISFAQAIEKIRGKEGTKVKLSIKSSGQETREVVITRKRISVPSYKLEFRQTDDGKDYAYLKLIQFGDDLAPALHFLAGKIRASDPDGIVLDMRDNPGGLLDASVSFSSLFLDQAPIVIEEDGSGKRRNFKPSRQASLKKYPLVALINAGSASASEIVAGALQDYGEAKIVGEKSFGKGSVQDLIRLKDGSTLRLTIAKWLTPKGREISDQGIVPDIDIKDDHDTRNNKTNQDKQLSKALEVLFGDQN